MNLPAGPPSEQSDIAGGPPPAAPSAALDLDRIERDLSGVEAALRRLDDGTYWTDDATGAEIPDHVLASDPVARRAEPGH